ncbi:right-handed parallel beta-helix repeat-containing protein [Microbacterium sp. LWH12-1.2]|uniref:right-handed parallel beta-helix repeat-containing protein n=1 Tax=Microbacterium sp. LWH12-1.2 TaxID=3135259 RepID=UPI00341D3E85
MRSSVKPYAGALRVLVGVLAVSGVVSALVACSSPEAAPSALEVVHVPADATLDEAGGLVADGGIILIAPGTYHGTLAVTADDVTVRGEDRNEVVLDGELTLSHGVVGTGERVTVENLTVRNYLQNGVLITGVTDENGAGIARGPDGYVPEAAPDPVPGYLVQFVTAQNNGLYGIYAFNRTDGVIRDNLASGGSDSGIYIGQCADCTALVADNVMQWNAVGLELANASNVVITGNRIVENRIGISVLSNYLEAHGPTEGVRIVGNVIADNVEERTPTQASGAFGTGIGLGGTVAAEVRANLITGNANVGVWLTSSEDFAPTDNRIADNAWAGNGLDVAYTATAHALGADNCFALSAGATADPSTLLAGGCAEPDVAPGGYTQPAAPAGVSFAAVDLPPTRPGLDDVDETPRRLPTTVNLPDTDAIPVPDAALLEDAS